ncbi:MAG: glycosyltransferase family 4 protein [Actinomycetota bacterium]
MNTLLNINKFHYRRGGADIVYLEQSRLLRDRGWRVAEFSMHHPENLESEWSRYWVDEIDIDGDYSVVDRVVRAGRVVWSGQARNRLERLLDDVDVDVAHAHNIYHQLSPAILPLLHGRGIPTVLTTHDLKLACPAYQMMTHDGVCERCKGGRLHQVVAQRCIKGSRAASAIIFAEAAAHRLMKTYQRSVDRFVSPSRFYIDKFAEWGWDRERFAHIPNHIAPHEFTPADPVVDGAGEAFVYFGRLSPEKGVETMIRAAARADVPLWLVGTGADADRLHDVAAEVGADVEFCGYLTGAPLHDRIRRARVNVLASEWYENGPVSVLEAYALGTPLLGARIGGIPEFLREGETGVSFESGSVDDLADAMGRLRDLPDAEIVEMGRAGRRWVEVDFTADRYIERLLGLYDELGVSNSPVSAGGPT